MANISSDTLRFYDEIQLLNPDYINPSNNYRFYSEEQVKELLYIIHLKECGFNLEEIKVIVKSKDKSKITQILTKKKNDLLNQNEKINSSIKKINCELQAVEEIDVTKNVMDSLISNFTKTSSL